MISAIVILTITISLSGNTNLAYATEVSEELNTETLVETLDKDIETESIFEELPEQEVPLADEFENVFNDLISETKEDNNNTEEIIINEKLVDVIQEEYTAEEESFQVIVDETEEENNFDDTNISMSTMAEDEEKSKNVNLQSVEYTTINNGEVIFDVDITDDGYSASVVELDEANRDELYHLVMGEAGTEGYEGAALVAQAIRDAIVYKGYDNVEQVRTEMSYDGKLDNNPSDEVKRAVDFVFDQGGSAVKHKILYFYNPTVTSSAFHESQQLVIEYGHHRFFSSWE